MREWIEDHPDLTTWVVLAVGMVTILVWSARDQGLTPPQWGWLTLATVILAGLCAWIISWEAGPDDEAESEQEPAQ